MNAPIIIIGMGEMGSVFARSLLRLGHPVYPVNRDEDMASVARTLPAPALVLVAVGENDLHPVLAQLPAVWHDRVGLLQNELLPRDWQEYGLNQPTVIAVWFEKKKGQDVKVLVPSPTYGPGAGLLVQGLATLGIPACELEDEAALRFELVRKNVYILTTNIAGLRVGGDAATLWSAHQDLARQVADEVMDIQFYLIGEPLDREALIAGMVAGIEGDPAHPCMGRSAPARLARALRHADEAGLDVPTLRAIHAQTTG